MTKSKLPDELIDAYRQAQYRVGDGAGAFCLRVGMRSMELANLFRDRGVSSATYITAWNPYGREASAAGNEAAQAELLRELRARSVAWVASASQAPDGRHPEEGVLALGLERDQAKALGVKFGQNAVVHAGTDATPELLLLR